MKETANINKSLVCLGNVIAALSKQVGRVSFFRKAAAETVRKRDFLACIFGFFS